MKRLSQSGSSNFCPELRKNALLISQSHFSNFALHVIISVTTQLHYSNKDENGTGACFIHAVSKMERSVNGPKKS